MLGLFLVLWAHINFTTAAVAEPLGRCRWLPLRSCFRACQALLPAPCNSASAASPCSPAISHTPATSRHQAAP